MPELRGERLVLRVDASSTIGTGHLMRCLALAQAWQSLQGRTVFALAESAPALEARLTAEGMEVVHLTASPSSSEDARATSELALAQRAKWLVVDGLHFDAAYQQRVKDAGLRLLVIDDDGHAGRYVADLVLNQNLHAHIGMYPQRSSSTRLLLGAQYLLLRREFWPWRGWVREIPAEARRVLVTLGGADPDNVTAKVVQALQGVEVEGLELLVVVGGSNPHHGMLAETIGSSHRPARLLRNVTNMPELMAQADLAVSSGGTTVWEAAFMGLPSIVGIIAPVEELLVSGLQQHGLYWHAGWLREVAPDELAELTVRLARDEGARRAMSRLGRDLVDGCGGARVVEAMVEGEGA